MLCPSNLLSIYLWIYANKEPRHSAESHFIFGERARIQSVHKMPPRRTSESKNKGKFILQEKVVLGKAGRGSIHSLSKNHSSSIKRRSKPGALEHKEKHMNPAVPKNAITAVAVAIQGCSEAASAA